MTGLSLTFLKEHFLHWIESLGLYVSFQMEYYRSKSFYIKSGMSHTLADCNYILILNDNSLNPLQILIGLLNS